MADTVRRVKVISLALALLAFSALGNSIAFFDRGKSTKQLTLREMQRLVPVQSVTVFEPHEKKKMTYRGFSFNALMDKVYGLEWTEREELLATCEDGYQPSISIQTFKQFPSFLVYESEGTDGFKIVNKLQGGERVPLGPFYLIWDNLKFPDVSKEGATVWPYQIKAIDLIRFSDKFPRMAPPLKASAAVRRGFGVFRKDCLPCHTINGEGGAKGVELNYPASVTEYFQAEWLRRWILDPSTIRFGSNMPAFSKQRVDAKKDLDDLIAYLREMARNKKAPN